MSWALTAAIVVNRISTAHLLEFYLLLAISSSDRHLVYVVANTNTNLEKYIKYNL